jgi:hypothetical protein
MIIHPFTHGQWLNYDSPIFREKAQDDAGILTEPKGEQSNETGAQAHDN